MSKFSKFLITAAIAAVVLPSAAMAAVVGTSDGSFSSITNCSGSNCGLANTVNGTNTQLQWGSTSQSTNLVNPSTLTAVDVAIGSFTTAQTNVKIAQLTWFNNATRSDQTDDDFNVNYNLVINFTQPSSSTGDSETFALRIVSPTNATGDSVGAFTVPDLNALSFNLPGWTVNGFQYVVDGGTTFGTCTDVSGSSNWCNPENNTGHLYIEANFTPNATSVPEPVTLSLFGAGLVGAAAFGMRRRKKA